MSASILDIPSLPPQCSKEWGTCANGWPHICVLDKDHEDLCQCAECGEEA